MANQSGIEEIESILNWQGIAMRYTRRRNRQDVTLKSLKRRLRALGELEPPPELKAELVAAIPHGQSKPQPRLGPAPAAWDFGVTAAAAVLIFALLWVVNYGLAVPARLLHTQVVDTSLCYPALGQSLVLFDQNNMLIEDTNYTGYNGRH